MQLIINTYGSYLKKKEGVLLVKTEDKEFEVSPKKIESILITTGAYLSTDAIKFAMENNIDLIFLVVYLFSQRRVKKEYFDPVKGGLTLNKEGKAILISALNETLEKTVRYRGRNIKNRDIIQFECHRIANNLIKEEKYASLGDI